MTALQNMTLNLTVSGLSKEEANKKALETARTLGLEELLDKKPGKLSGANDNVSRSEERWYATQSVT